MEANRANLRAHQFSLRDRLVHRLANYVLSFGSRHLREASPLANILRQDAIAVPEELDEESRGSRNSSPGQVARAAAGPSLVETEEETTGSSGQVARAAAGPFLVQYDETTAGSPVHVARADPGPSLFQTGSNTAGSPGEVANAAAGPSPVQTELNTGSLQNNQLEQNGTVDDELQSSLQNNQQLEQNGPNSNGTDDELQRNPLQHEAGQHWMAWLQHEAQHWILDIFRGSLDKFISAVSAFLLWCFICIPVACNCCAFIQTSGSEMILLVLGAIGLTVLQVWVIGMLVFSAVEVHISTFGRLMVRGALNYAARYVDQNEVDVMSFLVTMALAPYSIVLCRLLTIVDAEWLYESVVYVSSHSLCSLTGQGILGTILGLCYIGIMYLAHLVLLEYLGPPHHI